MPAKKIINDEQLLSMLRQGESRKDIAKRFGVSVVAIGKRLKRLLPSSNVILENRNLTDKEKAFILERARGKTLVQAVQSAYDVTSLQSAKSLGTTLIKKPEIKQSIQEIMENEGLTRTYRIRKLRTLIDNHDPNIAYKGLDMSNRMDGSYAAERHEISVEHEISDIIDRIERRYMQIDITPEDEVTDDLSAIVDIPKNEPSAGA